MNYFKTLSASALLTLLSFQSLSATLYEDAEDNTVEGWVVYDNTPAGATITNIIDNQKNSRVIKLNGDGRANGYMLGAKSGDNSWKNSLEKELNWSMKVNGKYKFYVMLETKKGARYLYYSYHDRDKGLISNKHIHIGLGSSSMNGSWHDYKRDLEADLKKYENDNSIISVNGVRIKGSVTVDNIELKGKGNKSKTIDKKVSSKSATAEEYKGQINLRSSDLELIQDHSKVQIVGIQFGALNIPKNAIIKKAYIQFVTDEKSSGEASLVIHGEKVDSAELFTKSNNNISLRAKTSASVSWTPAEWNIIGERGVAQRTSDLKSIVQEIVDQDGWSSGNAMAFIIEGSGRRTAESYNGDGVLAPVLHIEYGNGGGGEEPINNDFINVPEDYETIRDAIFNAKDGDTIILDSGIYRISEGLNVHHKNLTIASKYLTTGDKSYIDSTVIEGAEPNSQLRFIQGKAENLKLIGVTGKNFSKFIVFNYGNGNLVDHCKMINIDGDSVSFDSTAGGKVLHSFIDYSGDDAIDVDSKVQGEFEFAHNTILHSHDDGMEIHLWRDKHNDIVKTMTFNIHDNIINLSHKDGIQLIDFADTTNRTFNISNNTFSNNGHVAVGAIFEKTNHSLPETNFSGTSMKESVKVLNNIFDSNQYHLLGGDNMEVKGNSFKNASKVAIKRVKGSSIIENNTFLNNSVDRIDSN